MNTSTSHWMGVGLTDTGRVRKNNQDAFWVANHAGLFVVADGMGGHAGGDVASRLAVETFQKAVASPDMGNSMAHQIRFQTESALRRIVADANMTIFEAAHRSPELRNMGTTLLAASVLDADEVAVVRIVHVGDSRAYLFRQGRLRQMTHDHSVVEDFVRRGLLSPEEAAVHPKRHALTRAVGIDAAVEPDYLAETIEPGDVLLLCTDGLTKMLIDRDIEGFIDRLGAVPSSLCRALVDECNHRGGDDNITVVVCTHTSTSAEQHAIDKLSRRL